MKALVVGANGFLGRNVVSACLSKGWRVACIYRDKKDHIPNECEAFSYDKVASMPTRYDVVFLLAAVIPYGSFDKPSDQLLESNIRLPLTIVSRFTKSKVIFSSSVAVYGRHKDVITETSDFHNPSLYGLTKIAAETMLRFCKNYQIIRFSSLYGAGMSSDTFLPKIIEHAKHDKQITLFGDGSRLQDYIHVSDATGYLMAAVQRDESGIYLGVYGSPYSNSQVATIVQQHVPGCTIRYTGEDNSPSFSYNNAMTRKQLHFQPTVPLEEGIGELINE